MKLLDELKLLESFETIDEIKKRYTIESLKELYYKVITINKENDKLFNKYIEQDFINKDRLKSVWSMKSNLQQLTSVLLKAIVILEREDLILKSVLITDKLQNIVKKINS